MTLPTVRFSRKRSMAPAIRIMMMTDGSTRATVATTPPSTPAALVPAKVAMLTPMGPGVDSDTAIISASCPELNQPVFSAMALRKGIVAMPPPTEKRPVLKNS